MSEFSFLDHYSFQLLSCTFLSFWSPSLHVHSGIPSIFFLYFLCISCFWALRIHSVQLLIIYKSLITENYNKQLPLITTNSRPSQSHWDSDAKPQMPWRPTVTSTADLASSKACNLLEKQKKQKRKTAGLKIWLLYLTQTKGFNTGWVCVGGVWNSISISQESPQVVYAARL